MRYRKLRGTKLQPSILGIGCARIASMSTPHSRREITAALEMAIDGGVTFFDTADVYGQGDSERLLGRVLAGRRDRAVICTKAGLTLGAGQQLVRWTKPILQPLVRRWAAGRGGVARVRRQQERQCFEPAYLAQQIEGSLRRLRSDYIDLFLLHNPPHDLPAKSAVVNVLESKRQAGEIRYFGVSCATAQDAGAWLQQPGIACVQLAGNLFDMHEIETLRRTPPGDEVGIICREPFAGGNLFGNPGLEAQVSDDLVARGPTAVALGYLIGRKEIDVVIAGITCRRHVAESLAAIDALKTPADASAGPGGENLNSRRPP